MARGARLPAGADVVVQRGRDTADGMVDPRQRFKPHLPRVATGIEQWQIAEFAEGDAAITTVTAARRTLGAGYARCAISAQAATFASTAGTLTH